MSNAKSGRRTMLLSILTSTPGPLAAGLGLLTGRSSTQIADFVRRCAEVLALIVSYAVYRITAANDDFCEKRRAVLERRSNAFVGLMMCVGGVVMLLLALQTGAEDKGNVIPGLLISGLGVVVNSAFWWKYAKLNKVGPNAILAVQARMYRAKSLVDGCVTVALTSVLIAPSSPVSQQLDLAGSVIVAAYLVWCGARTVWEAAGRKAGTVP